MWNNRRKAPMYYILRRLKRGAFRRGRGSTYKFKLAKIPKTNVPEGTWKEALIGLLAIVAVIYLTFRIIKWIFY